MIDSVSTNSTPITTRIIEATGDTAKQNVVPSQTDPSIVVTPESVNEFTYKAEDTYQNKQQTEQAQQDAIRNLALAVNQKQHKEDMVEQYVAQNTDSEYTPNNNGSATNIYDLAQQKIISDKLDTLSTISEVKDKYSTAITPREPSFFHIEA